MKDAVTNEKINLLTKQLETLKKTVTTKDMDHSDLAKSQKALALKLREMKDEMMREKLAHERVKGEKERMEQELKQKVQDLEHSLQENDLEKQKQSRMITNLTDLAEKLERSVVEDKMKSGSHLSEIEKERCQL